MMKYSKIQYNVIQHKTLLIHSKKQKYGISKYNTVYNKSNVVQDDGPRKLILGRLDYNKK